MVTVEIGGRKMPLRFTMMGMERAEEIFGSVNDMTRELRSRRTVLRAMHELLGVMLTCGGDGTVYDHTWVITHIDIRLEKEYQLAVAGVLKDAMSRTVDVKDEGEKDLVLEELRRKEAEKNGGVSSR